MPHMLIFGLGYTASRIAVALRARGWAVTATRRSPVPDDAADVIAFDDMPRVAAAIGRATHILSSVPPQDDIDPVLSRYGAALHEIGWLGYLSSTGVYGDAGGAWVDEGTPVGSGRRGARAAADLAWLAKGARCFRLPGIYGPGRSPLDRVAAGRAHRIDLPEQVFSRVHVDDIVGGVIGALEAPAGAYNLADDLPASPNAVVEYACALLGLPVPPLRTLDDPSLSPMARGFYRENRRIANGRAKRVLRWRLRYPDYRAGLGVLSASASPPSASAAPAADPADQR